MATFSVRRSGSAPVVMMEVTEYRKGLDAALNLGRSGNGVLMGESLVRPRLVVKARELGDEALKVRLAEDQHVVEQFASEGADKPFRIGVHVRRTDRGTHDARVDCGEGAHKSSLRTSSRGRRPVPAMRFHNKVASRACCAHQGSVGV